MRKSWPFEEDFIVAKFYLSHVDSWKEHIDELLEELKQAGFEREKKKVETRISNYRYVHTGRGLAHIAKQSYRIYDGIIKAKVSALIS